MLPTCCFFSKAVVLVIFVLTIGRAAQGLSSHSQRAVDAKILEAAAGPHDGTRSLRRSEYQPKSPFLRGRAIAAFLQLPSSAPHLYRRMESGTPPLSGPRAEYIRLTQEVEALHREMHQLQPQIHAITRWRWALERENARLSPESQTRLRQMMAQLLRMY